MRYFTDNPLERMMMRVPPARPIGQQHPQAPKGHPCYGCKRYGEVCVLPCYRGIKRPPAAKG